MKLKKEKSYMEINRSLVDAMERIRWQQARVYWRAIDNRIRNYYDKSK